MRTSMSIVRLEGTAHQRAQLQPDLRVDRIQRPHRRGDIRKALVQLLVLDGLSVDHLEPLDNRSRPHPEEVDAVIRDRGRAQVRQVTRR